MDYDIAILTALPKELEAVRKHLPLREEVKGSSEFLRNYYQGETPQGISVVAVCALGMGQLNAALLTRNVIAEFNPRKIILAGIAAAVSQDVKLGDVVASDQIVDYELGKVTAEGLRPRWSVYRSDPRLVQGLLNFNETAWAKRISLPRPDGNDLAQPHLHVGVVLSGNKVIADAKTADALVSIWTRALALEMEAVGIAAALYQTPNAPEFIMIKGICDYADANKNDNWQEYAAEASAALIASFIEVSVGRKDLAAFPLREETEVQLGNIDYRGLRFTLSELFGLSDLKALVFDMGDDWEDIPGDIKTEKIIELILYMKRRSRLNDLLDAIKRARPQLLETYKA